ncbi:hypothetical protein OCU04_007030 [Sclerotinia nivalis]|uniref:Uncharacterized protein n=1 Tax=Sclerotinia nivalis TaxID=352851 RepID=A0A9X0DJI2_9HELO|nr:hypothetical protein OCU04_007030 [Sclerotinia nivalis]
MRIKMVYGISSASRHSSYSPPREYPTILNLFQSFVLTPFNNIQNMLSELDIIVGILKEIAVELLHVIIEFILFPGNIETSFSSVHGDAEGCSIEQCDIFILALSELLVKFFGDVDA